MAGAASVFEIRSTATAGNVNGGGFVPGASGTDYSQQNAAQYALTGVTSGGAGNTILTASAAADMVGNWLCVISGTNLTLENNSGIGRFEIVSVVAGVSITCSTNYSGTAISTGIASNGVINVGGAFSLGHASDDGIFEIASTIGGHTFYIKNGSYTPGATLNTGAAGTSQLFNVMEGYATTRGDRPSASTRPTLTLTAALFTTGAAWHYRNIIFTSTSATGVVSLGTASTLTECKVTNTGVGATAYAVALGNDCLVSRCEIVNNAGYGINGANGALIGNYIHDCLIGVRSTTTTQSLFISRNIIESCTTSAISFTSSASGHCLIFMNTLYGAETPAGIGIDVAAGVTDLRIMNNIIYGFVTGLTHATAGQTVGLENFNAYDNNTTDVTNFTLGSSSITTAITFTNAAGGNFAPTSVNVMGTGYPGVNFPGGLTPASQTIGAVSAAADYPAITDVEAGVTFAYATLTGTLVVGSETTSGSFSG